MKEEKLDRDNREQAKANEYKDQTAEYHSGEQLSDQRLELLVTDILDIGELLLRSGAEVSRVEDTVERIGGAYGFARTDIFTITSSIVYTVHTKDGKVITQTRRIKDAADDMERLERINALSRQICSKPVSPEELKDMIRGVRQVRHYNNVLLMFAYILISVSFTIFFGGSILDAVASMLAGIVLYLVVTLGNLIQMQKMILIIFSSFITGLTAAMLIGIGIGESFDKIVIGNIMLLIPGKAFTTSLRDILKGDMISGSLGMLEALFRASGIALGFAMVMLIKGVD